MQTESLGHGDIKFYPPPTKHRSMDHHYTDNISHIEESTPNLWVHIFRWSGQLKFTPLLQLTIDLWNTTTPISFTYSRMQTESLGHGDIKFYPPPTKHRSMDHHYTDNISHIEESTPNLWVHIFRWSGQLKFTPLLQLTIDLWNTTTPNKFHI